jgi:hypothetical protein
LLGSRCLKNAQKKIVRVFTEFSSIFLKAKKSIPVVMKLSLLMLMLHSCLSFRTFNREKSLDGKPHLVDVNQDPNNDEPPGALFVDFNKCDDFLKNGKDTFASLRCENDEFRRLLLILLSHGERLSRDTDMLKKEQAKISDMLFENGGYEAPEPKQKQKQKVVYHYQFGEPLPVVSEK